MIELVWLFGEQIHCREIEMLWFVSWLELVLHGASQGSAPIAELMSTTSKSDNLLKRSRPSVVSSLLEYKN